MTYGLNPRERGDARVAVAERILRAACGNRARSAFPLAPLTSFRIGGPAALYVDADGDMDLHAAAEAVAVTGLPWTVIGKGSNVLVSDGGFPGIVIRLGKGYRWASRDGTHLHAGGSMPLPALAGVALTHRLTGLEFGVAIPASLGGAVRMNAGAHGRSMADVVGSIELFSMAEASRQTVEAPVAGFAYRTSDLPAEGIVVAASLSLSAGEEEGIRRAMDEARVWRRETQPLAEPNCGSVFKNPPGDHAARMVEAVGAKGLRVGGAAVSRKHSNFIVADPGTRAGDVARLIRELQRRVEDRFGVRLEPEVQLVGEFDVASL